MHLSEKGINGRSSSSGRSVKEITKTKIEDEEYLDQREDQRRKLKKP